MNPWSFLVIGLGVLLIIMGVKGSYENVVSALTGKPHSVPGGTSTTGTTPPPAGNVLLPQRGLRNPASSFPFVGPSNRTPGTVMV